MRYVGLDVHAEFAQVTQILEGGDVEHYRLSLDSAGLEELKSRLGPDTQVVLEASSGTFRLCDELAEAAGVLIVANPAQTRGASATHVKTDVRDSEMLARLLRAGFIRPVWIADRETREIRGLVQHRVQLGRMMTKCKNGVRGVLSDARVKPPVRTLFSKQGLVWLSTLEVAPLCTVRLESLLRMRAAFEEEIGSVDYALESWSRQREDTRRLITIPGMSWQLAAAIVSQIGDIRRFTTPGKLCAYAGLVPRVRQSGKKTSIGGVVNCGRGVFRHVLFHVVKWAARRPGRIQDFYGRLAANRPKAVARVAAMRKLLTIIWRMLVNQQDYRGYDEDAVARKLKRGLKRSTRDASPPPQ